MIRFTLPLLILALLSALVAFALLNENYADARKICEQRYTPDTCAHSMR